MNVGKNSREMGRCMSSILLPSKVPHLSAGVIKRYIVILLFLCKLFFIFCHKKFGGKTGLLVISLLNCSNNLFGSRLYLQTTVCTALSPAASCLSSTISSQQNTCIIGIIILDRDRVKLQVQKEEMHFDKYR